MTRSNSSTTKIIYAPIFTLKRPSDWAWAFYDFANSVKNLAGELHHEYRFISQFKDVSADDDVIFIGITKQIISWAKKHPNNSQFILFGERNIKLLSQHEDVLSQVIHITLIGASAPQSWQSNNLTALPEKKGVYPTDIKDYSYSNFALEIKPPFDVLALLSPPNYLSIWEFFISHRFVPRKIYIYDRLLKCIPDWFIHALKPYGTKIYVKELTENALKELKNKKIPVLRNQVSCDYANAMAVKCGVSVNTISSNAQLGAQPILKKDQIVPITTLLYQEKKPNVIKELKSTTTTKIQDSVINIVCYNPTYLFADLTQRFVNAGCVHSEFPLAGADGYIWIRPQEYIAVQSFLSDAEMIDVPESYKKILRTRKNFKETFNQQALAQKSTAIHHGTCFPPIVQFNAEYLALKLSTIKTVAGVCPFEECYGPSAKIANKNNFDFIPIGYDSSLFTERLISSKKSKEFNLGFVGRAYGTNKKSALEASIYAHPLGYRKGGDILKAIAMELHTLKLPLHLHIVGQNWEKLVKNLEMASIKVTYYNRDKNINYENYPSVFSKFDALCIAARAEGGPVSAIEAMSVGVPIVGTNVGLIPYLNQISPKGCRIYDYDTKWHQADTEKAVNEIVDLYKNPLNQREKKYIRETIKSFSTNNWIHRVIESTGCNHIKV